MDYLIIISILIITGAFILMLIPEAIGILKKISLSLYFTIFLLGCMLCTMQKWKLNLGVIALYYLGALLFNCGTLALDDNSFTMFWGWGSENSEEPYAYKVLALSKNLPTTSSMGTSEENEILSDNSEVTTTTLVNSDEDILEGILNDALNEILSDDSQEDIAEELIEQKLPETSQDVRSVPDTSPEETPRRLKSAMQLKAEEAGYASLLDYLNAENRPDGEIPDNKEEQGIRRGRMLTLVTFAGVVLLNIFSGK